MWKTQQFLIVRMGNSCFFQGFSTSTVSTRLTRPLQRRMLHPHWSHGLVSSGRNASQEPSFSTRRWHPNCGSGTIQPKTFGGLEHFLFSHILGISSSQLTFIFFRGVAQPPTRKTGFPTTRSHQIHSNPRIGLREKLQRNPRILMV